MKHHSPTEFLYPAKLHPEAKGAFTVTFRHFPEAITSGTRKTDALDQAADALQEAIAGRMVRKQEIPTAPGPGSRRGECDVPVALYLAPKLALYQAMREERMNNRQLAFRLGVTETVVRRMLNPRHDTKPERIQEALAILGKRVLVAVA